MKGVLLVLPFRNSCCRHPHRFGLSVVRACLDNACMRGQAPHMPVCCVGSHEGGNPSFWVCVCARVCVPPSHVGVVSLQEMGKVRRTAATP
ncbi:hypothetical protein LY76DRAFT_87327 [Colletotrichum caudatum]|nr:hypothetical protein LY76DRAFT_87327 [Colletotrichum caudatum]